MSKRKGIRFAAVVLSLSLVAAACGDDDDDVADEPTEEPADEPTEEPADEPTEEPADEPTEEPADEGGDMEELPTEGEVEVAAGTVLNLPECPDDWSATQGVDGDEIRLGMTVPRSGPAASFGLIGEGMEMYFEYLNDNDPIVDGKDLVLVMKDDGYEAGRAVANVEEMVDTEDIFAIVHSVGTPANLAIRPITDENCVPQLFNSTGFPLWGDPANYPWTIGNILNYVTETEIWCSSIVSELGEGATVAALYMNNDFGTTYKNTMDNSEACSSLEVVAEALHDPAADTIQNEMTTLISSGADVLIAGTTSSYCPQTTASVAASDWRPLFYMSYTCNNLAAYFLPVQEAAATLAAEGSGVRMTNSNKICGDPQFADDPAIQQTEQILEEYGGVSCDDGSYSIGVLYAQLVENVLRDAAARPGGLNRVNLMASVWNGDYDNELLLGGSLITDGVNDAYWTEAAQVQAVEEADGGLTFVSVGDFIDLEGQGGSYQG